MEKVSNNCLAKGKEMASQRKRIIAKMYRREWMEALIGTLSIDAIKTVEGMKGVVQ
ncbi:MAG: hypothetical protein ACLR23_08685 [Clostridia bacterium]